MMEFPPGFDAESYAAAIREGRVSEGEPRGHLADLTTEAPEAMTREAIQARRAGKVRLRLGEKAPEPPPGRR